MLYLVPACLLSSLILATIRHEHSQLWSYDEEKLIEEKNRKKEEGEENDESDDKDKLKKVYFSFFIFLFFRNK